MKHKLTIVLCSVALLASGLLFDGAVASSGEGDYEFALTWGGKGSGPGQFNNVTALAIAGQELFVADARNSRIQVFDMAGKFKRQFDVEPGKKTKLSRPMGLAIHGGELYVTDYLNDRIAVFALAGAPRRTIGGPGSGPGEFNSPGGIALTPAGGLIVADFNNQRVQELRADGTFVRQWGETGHRGIMSGKFNYPTDVALGADGIMLVADGFNDRVQAFSPDGEFSHKWGGLLAMNLSGSAEGWFKMVSGIAVDKKSNVFVADFYNHRVQKFLPDGTFLTLFGEKGDGPGQFNLPKAVAVADDGAVFVADFGNNRIQKWLPKR